MCDFCNKKNKKTGHFENESMSEELSMTIVNKDKFNTHNKLSLSYYAHSVDSDFHEDIEIKFCPMCGRKL